MGLTATARPCLGSCQMTPNFWCTSLLGDVEAPEAAEELTPTAVDEAEDLDDIDALPLDESDATNRV